MMGMEMHDLLKMQLLLSEYGISLVESSHLPLFEFDAMVAIALKQKEEKIDLMIELAKAGVPHLALS